MVTNYHFEWTEGISVHESHIDYQHQKLLAQVNKLIEGTLHKFDVKVLQEAIYFFDQYIREHFSYEEKYMIGMNYSEIEKHLALHQEFVKQYDLFKRRVDESSTPEVLLEMETYIGNWWLNHIGKEDKKYDEYSKNTK